MSDDELKLIMNSLGLAVLEGQNDPTGAISILISETVRFRDKLKENTGEILTVDDTRKALDALDCHLKREPLPEDMTSEQKTLTQIWIDRLTVFGQ